MLTENVTWFPCRPADAYRLAAQVDQWPKVLPHYRWVRFHQGGPASGGVVEMAARRDFGRLGWPVWWVSQMWCDEDSLRVHYRHIDGITRGMAVEWAVQPSGSGSWVSVRHEWAEGPRFCGPAGPMVGRALVGPVFVYHIAERTLTSLAARAGKGLAV